MLESAPGFRSHQGEKGDTADDTLEMSGRGHWTQFKEEGCQFSNTVSNPSNVLWMSLFMECYAYIYEMGHIPAH